MTTNTRDHHGVGVQVHITGPLTRGRVLARNTVWNLLGQGVPLLVAIPAIPILIRTLGTDRFGILTLAWVVIGYFSLFDFGLGRALTQLVSRNLGMQEQEQIPGLIWTALIMMFCLGVIGALAVALASPWLVRSILRIPSGLQGESLNAFLLLAASIPVVISTAALRGVLEAHQQFALSNAVRIPSGLFTYIGPVLVLPFSKSLFWIVAILLFGRIVTSAAYLVLGLRTVPSLGNRIALDRSVVVPLFRFGGWMTISNVVGPLMVYLDRFLIGTQISVAAVAYYATPYEIITKLLIIPGALTGVLFPAFSTSFVQDRDHAGLLVRRSMKYLFLTLFPGILLIVALAHQGLTLWLGSRFADHSAPVLQWLAVGVLFNSIAQIPFALVQGAGRPNLTAKLHLIELPLYVVALLWLLARFGIEGAAIAWAARTGIDMLVLFIMAFRLIPISVSNRARMGLTLGAAILALGLASVPTSLGLKLTGLVVVLLGFGLVAWFQILSPEERAFRGLGS
jgi:O-antigen/teichoic acid export membrane protein